MSRTSRTNPDSCTAVPYRLRLVVDAGVAVVREGGAVREELLLGPDTNPDEDQARGVPLRGAATTALRAGLVLLLLRRGAVHVAALQPAMGAPVTQQSLRVVAEDVLEVGVACRVAQEVFPRELPRRGQTEREAPGIGPVAAREDVQLAAVGIRDRAHGTRDRAAHRGVHVLEKTVNSLSLHQHDMPARLADVDAGRRRRARRAREARRRMQGSRLAEQSEVGASLHLTAVACAVVVAAASVPVKERREAAARLSEAQRRALRLARIELVPTVVETLRAMDVVPHQFHFARLGGRGRQPEARIEGAW
eukprot:scaffold37678_cov65-Phaeocystis_antarctica.AAC.2